MFRVCQAGTQPLSFHADHHLSTQIVNDLVMLDCVGGPDGIKLAGTKNMLPYSDTCKSAALLYQLMHLQAIKTNDSDTMPQGLRAHHLTNSTQQNTKQTFLTRLSKRVESTLTKSVRSTLTKTATDILSNAAVQRTL